MATRGHWQAFSAVLVASALLLSGCHLLSGGGWIPSLADLNQKATFGFNGHCKLEDIAIDPGSAYWFYEGQFQYMDKAAGVRFHADIDPFIGFFRDGIDSCRAAGEAMIALLDNPDSAQLFGTYRQQPGGGTGDIRIEVTDMGEPGGPNGDQLCVTLVSGPLVGYSNCGTIQGGNIQVQ